MFRILCILLVSLFWPNLTWSLNLSGTTPHDFVLIPMDWELIPAPGGDGAGNGGGPDKNFVISAESLISQQIQLCQKTNFCSNDTTSFLSLIDIHHKQEQPIEFKTSKDDPRLLSTNLHEKVFISGNSPGSENIINSRLLDTKTNLDGYKYVLSLYSYHHHSVSNSQKIKEASDFYAFLENVTILSDLSHWSQPHIFFLTHKNEPSLIITDLTDSYRVPMDETCQTVEWFRIENFFLNLLNAGYVKAEVQIRYSCNGIEKGIRLLPIIFFENNLNWIQFFAATEHYHLKIKRVAWQKFLL